RCLFCGAQFRVPRDDDYFDSDDGDAYNEDDEEIVIHGQDEDLDGPNEYDTEAYKIHIDRYESLSNTFEKQDGYQYESKIKTVLHGLNFTESDFNRPINDFSGGQKTRLSLAQMLL
ncbi:MAG: hypothetical protein ACTIBB_04530, partial [Staphylococcus saprophyticus]